MYITVNSQSRMQFIDKQQDQAKYMVTENSRVEVLEINCQICGSELFRLLLVNSK
jgi:hypothetical protein